VAWGITANHGGGYQYRLCPADQDPTEACFQKHVLPFVGDKQWLQYGDGQDVNNRTEIPVVEVSGDKVVPAGSKWRRNPIPPCNTPIAGGALHTFSGLCTGPTFKAPAPGAWGFGPGACGSSCLEPSALLRNFWIRISISELLTKCKCRMFLLETMSSASGGIRSKHHKCGILVPMSRLLPAERPPKLSQVSEVAMVAALRRRASVPTALVASTTRQVLALIAGSL